MGSVNVKSNCGQTYAVHFRRSDGKKMDTVVLSNGEKVPNPAMLRTGEDLEIMAGNFDGSQMEMVSPPENLGLVGSPLPLHRPYVADPDPSKVFYAIATETPEKIGSQPFLARGVDGRPDPDKPQDTLTGIWTGSWSEARSYCSSYIGSQGGGRWYWPVAMDDDFVYDRIGSLKETVQAPVTVTEVIRNLPAVVALRRKVRENAQEVTAAQLKSTFENWAKMWKSRWLIQEWDSKFYVGLKEDVLEAVRLAGTARVKYIVEYGDCNHFAKRCSGIVDTMLADPDDNFGLGGTLGIVGDFGAHHSFILAIVHTGKDGNGETMLEPIIIEPQSDGEVKPSNDPKSLYDVADSGEVFFL